MQLQQQAIRVFDRRNFGCSVRESEHSIGFAGEPTVWLKGTKPNSYAIGELFVVSSTHDNRDYYYLVKEYKDGWWKLEWPD